MAELKTKKVEANLPAKVNSAISQVRQFITFRVGVELFGVNIMCVEEIITPRSITAIPRTPEYFLGIINLRGEVISIIDMRMRFAIEPQEITASSRIIVVLTQGVKLGMLVDQINSIVSIDDAAMHDTSTIATRESKKFISGSYKLSDKTILLLLLQDQLIEKEDFLIHKEVQDTQEITEVASAKKEVVIREVNLVGFSLAGEQYTIESLSVEEIIPYPEITLIPEMKNFIEGIFHLRNSVIPVIKLADRMGIESSQIEADSPVIIVKVNDIKIGLIVDQITEVFLIGEDDILPPPINLNQKQIEHLKGVIKLEREGENQINMLLKLEKLFTQDERSLLEDLDSGNDNKELEAVNEEEEFPILEFILADERYAIPVMETNEIIPVREIVPVPKSPAYIKGVINLRGDVISIVDLPLLVGDKGYHFTDDTKLLIVNPGNEVAGVIVAKVIGIRKVALSSFEKPSDLIRQKGNIFIEGIGRVEETGEIVVLMDIATTLTQSQTDDEYSDLSSVKEELELLELEDQQSTRLLTENTQ